MQVQTSTGQGVRSSKRSLFAYSHPLQIFRETMTSNENCNRYLIIFVVTIKMSHNQLDVKVAKSVAIYVANDALAYEIIPQTF